MANNMKIGCSSFNNPLWKGVFYPEKLPSKEWFSYYCEHFNTYEFNGSFYKFPTIKVFDNWYKKTPDDFVFSVKAPKEITHLRKFIDCEHLIADFYSVAELGFRDKLGPILFQFPPSFTFSLERLTLIVTSLNLNFTNVLEFRHQSWWVPEVFSFLKVNKITMCSVNHPQLPTSIFSDASFIYLRLHGRTRLFYSQYSAEELKSIKNKIKGTTAFVYFNNTASNAGILNALQMQNL